MRIISDLHLYHGNVIKYENRPFPDLEAMNAFIVTAWNSTVSKRDFVYVLGDIAFGNKEMIKNIVSQLHGRIYLILGNHDQSRSVKWWMDCGFEWVSKHPIIYEERYIFSHRPIINLGTEFYNVHGHLHSKLYTEDDRHFNVSADNIGYYPMDFNRVKEKIKNKEVR
jgi:calcineurin-like phosphoesterase family protein